MMFIVSCVKGGTQGPLLMIHTKVLIPTPRLVIGVFRLFGFAMVAVPAIRVQVPGVGCAFITVLVVGVQSN